MPLVTVSPGVKGKQVPTTGFCLNLQIILAIPLKQVPEPQQVIAFSEFVCEK